MQLFMIRFVYHTEQCVSANQCKSVSYSVFSVLRLVDLSGLLCNVDEWSMSNLKELLYYIETYIEMYHE